MKKVSVAILHLLQISNSQSTHFSLIDSCLEDSLSEIGYHGYHVEYVETGYHGYHVV